MRTAAIGIGSNSLRMLTAEIDNGILRRLTRYRQGLRVFAALDEQGNITREMMQRACDSVRAFRDAAIAEGVETVHLFATSAVRDARNQDVFIACLEQACGLQPEICSGDREAYLSFVGATDSDHAGLIDIGGGSTELAVGSRSCVDEAVSLQMGAVRLYRTLPLTNIEQAKCVVNAASQVLACERRRFADSRAREWVGVGGTFTTTAALVQGISWNDRQKIHGYVLTREAVEKALYELAPIPLEKRLKLPCMQPQRADIVAHGIAILLCCMTDLDIPQITVSEHGNLEGYLKDKYILSEIN